MTEGSAIRRIGHLRWLRNVAVALGNAPWDEANIQALESRRGEHPLLDEHIEWAIAQQIEKRNACVVEVQLPKNSGWSGSSKKDLRGMRELFTACV